MRRAILIAVLLLCCAVPALAEDLSPERRADILRLMEASGHKAMARQMLEQYAKQSMGMVKKLRSDIPADSLPAVERDLQGYLREKLDAPGGLFEQLAPVYAKRFSEDEVRELLKFYESPLGRKAVASLPALTKEGGEVAQRLGISLIPEINRRINDTLKREAARKAEAQQAQSAAPQQF